MDQFFQTYDRDGLRILAVSGDTDIYNSPALEAAILAATGDDARSLILDLTTLQYCDSTAISVLVRQRKRLAKRLQIVLPKKAKMRRVFAVLGLEEFLGLKEDVASVVEPLFLSRSAEQRGTYKERAVSGAS